MTYDEEERVERHLFSVPFRATTAEARRIYLQVYAHKAYREWSWRDDLIKSPGAVEFGDMALTRMSVQANEAYTELLLATAAAIEAMERDRDQN